MRKVFREGDLISVSVTSLAGGVLPAVAVCSPAADLLTEQRALAVLMRRDAHGHHQAPAAAKGMQQV